MVGDDEDVGLFEHAFGAERGEDGAERGVAVGHGGEGGGRAGHGEVLAVIRVAEPERAELGDAVAPELLGERARGPGVLRGVRRERLDVRVGGEFPERGGDRGERGGGIGLAGEKDGRAVARRAIEAAVVEQRDGLCAGDGGAVAGALDDFRERRHAHVFSRAQLVAAAATLRVLGGDRVEGMDVRAELDIGEDAGAPGVAAGGDGGAIDLGGGDIHGVVIAKERPARGERVQHRRGVGADEIRAHAIPHHEHHMLRLGRERGILRPREKGREQAGQEHGGKANGEHKRGLFTPAGQPAREKFPPRSCARL